MMKAFTHTLLVLILVCLFSSCSSAPVAGPVFPRSQWRATEALPTEVYADNITVGKFREVCDVLARDLVIQPFVTQAAHPPVITIRKIENKTGLPVDETIFQETIRVKLMERAGGSVLFRDDLSYRDIVKERLQQTNEDVTVTLTDSVVQTKTHDRLKERDYDTGALSGAGGSFEQADNVEEESKMETEQSGTVKGKIADADYLLRGIIYQMNEQNANQPIGGMSYFQYQFRIVDARTGLIVWEKMLDSKMEGAYAPSDSPQQQQQPGQQATGTAPAGWPTTAVATGSSTATGQTTQPGITQGATSPDNVTPSSSTQGTTQSWP